MDQRKSFKNKATKYFSEKNNFSEESFSYKDFGRNIRFISNSFNVIFIDDIDVVNYKYFIELM